MHVEFVELLPVLSDKAEQVFYDDYADYMVDAVLVDRYSRKSHIQRQIDEVVKADGHINSNNAGAVGHDVPGGHILVFKDIVYHLRGAFLDDVFAVAVVVRCLREGVYKVEHLVLRHRHIIRAERLFQQLRYPLVERHQPA